MKQNKYFILYYLDAFLTFGIIIFMLFCQSIIKYNPESVYYYTEFFEIYPILPILLIVSFALLVLIIFLKKKNEFKIESNLLPILYLCFFSIMVVSYFICNNFVVMKNIHLGYYYCILIPAHILLSIYTITLIDKKSKKKS